MQTLQIQEWRPWQARNARSKTFFGGKNQGRKKSPRGRSAKTKGTIPGTIPIVCKPRQTKSNEPLLIVNSRPMRGSVRLRAWGHCTREKQEDPRPATRASDTHLRQMSWGMLSSCLDHRQSSGKKVLGGQLRGTSCSFPHLPVVAHSGFLVACCCPCLIYSAGILCLAKTDVSLLCVCL
jgi:hypothetical protein